jgi:uncharacterized protein (DUF2141 family)
MSLQPADPARRQRVDDHRRDAGGTRGLSIAILQGLNAAAAVHLYNNREGAGAFGFDYPEVWAKPFGVSRWVEGHIGAPGVGQPSIDIIAIH